MRTVSRLRPWRTTAALAPLFAMVVGTLCFPSAGLAAVTVVRKPAVVTRHAFDPARPPAKLPHREPGEDAVTGSLFGVSTQLRTQPTTRRLPDGTYRSSILTDAPRLELQLTVDIWVPTNATEKLKAHEEGHRQISEKMYAEVADRAAKVAGDAIDGRRFTGEGGTAAEAEKAAAEAVEVAHKAMVKAYVDEVGTPNQQIHNVYDALTKHGRVAELAEADAIKQAWEKNTPRLWVPPKAPATGPAGKAKPTTRPEAGKLR